MNIHFIGIGGIGVSALAQHYLFKGNQVSGSDLVSSEITDKLKKEGVKIATGKHKANNLPQDTEIIIYSPAVRADNPEIKKARRLKNTNHKIKIKSYPQALGEITKKYFTIAVSGTHGKSTTASMAGLILAKAGLDPTVILGTKLKQFNNSNYRPGKSKYLLVEADEHFASFLNYWPRIIVLTRIEADHLDYFKNFNNLLKAFKKYLRRLPKNGLLIANKDDSIIHKTFLKAVKNTLWFSLEDKESKKLSKVLKVPGEHNIANALAALNIARSLKIPDKYSFQALLQYKGAWRRFEEKKVKINNKKIILISDYAHHPTEIEATLKAAVQKYSKKIIWCVYQPHQYQRTYHLFNNFIKAFQKASDKTFINKLIITDIYDVAGREEKKIRKKISSEKLAEKTKRKNVIYLPQKQILKNLKKNLLDFEILIIMGAGDIYRIIEKFKA